MHSTMQLPSALKFFARRRKRLSVNSIGISTMYEQRLTFSFEAAHRLPTDGERPDYERVHGHSFVVTLVLTGKVLSDGKWLCDFGVVRAVCDSLHARLDHRVLNDIAGLEIPTLENLAAWIFTAGAKDLPLLTKVTVERPTLGEKVSYAI